GGLPAILDSPHFSTPSSAFNILAIMSLGGFIAFLMLVAEFKLISETSVVTFSIAGIFKEILTIWLSMMIFGDRLTAWTVVGLVVSLGGIGGYNFVRMKDMYERHRKGRAAQLEREGSEEAELVAFVEGDEDADSGVGGGGAGAGGAGGDDSGHEDGHSTRRRSSSLSAAGSSTAKSKRNIGQNGKGVGGGGVDEGGGGAQTLFLIEDDL
ncbi:Triose-phosphate Transporter, partial [Quaeritorhiza haematococci]